MSNQTAVLEEPEITLDESIQLIGNLKEVNSDDSFVAELLGDRELETEAARFSMNEAA